MTLKVGDRYQPAGHSEKTDKKSLLSVAGWRYSEKIMKIKKYHGIEDQIWFDFFSNLGYVSVCSCGFFTGD